MSHLASRLPYFPIGITRRQCQCCERFDAAQVVFDSIAAGGIRLPSKRRADTRGADFRPNSPVPAFSASVSTPPQRPVLLVMEAQA